MPARSSSRRIARVALVAALWLGLGLITSVGVAWALQIWLPTRGTEQWTMLENPSTGARYELYSCSLESGWPAVCLWGKAGDQTHGIVAIGNTHLPISPSWTGLLADTAFYSTVWGLLFVVPRAIRRTLRRRGGRCVNCGYDLAGLLTPGGETVIKCPECGTVRG